MTEIQTVGVITPIIRKLLGRYYISPSPPAIFVFAALHAGAKTLQKRYRGVTSISQNVTNFGKRYKAEVSDCLEHLKVIAQWLKTCRDSQKMLLNDWLIDSKGRKKNQIAMANNHVESIKKLRRR